MTEFYFTDRKFNLIDVASTESGKYELSNVVDKQSIEESSRGFEATVEFNTENDELVSTVEEMTTEGNFVLYKDKQNNSVWITIEETTFDDVDGTAEISGTDAGIDIINELVGPYTPDKQYTIAQYIERFTKDSGFEIGVNEIPKLSRKLQGWESTETALARIISVATQFDNAELDFTFDVQGLDVVKKYINIYKKRGGGDNTTLYVGQELNKIVVKSDIYDLATAIYPTGGTPEGKDKPITLKGYKYTDPNGRYVLGGDGAMRDNEAIKKWSRLLSNENTDPIKSHIITRKSYETTNQKTLCDNVLRELKKISQPNVNYEVDIVDLPDNVNVGDTVNLVNERRELYLSARILTLDWDYLSSSGEATLGDYLIQEGRIDTDLRTLAESLKDKVDQMNATVNQKTKYIRSNTPPTETENVIWMDTSKTPNLVKTWDGTQWVAATPEKPEEVGAYPEGAGSALEGQVTVVEKDVEKVKGDIKDLGDDRILTPVEKIAIVLEIESIKATYVQLVKQATDVKVDLTDYGNKYQTLLNYINPLINNKQINSVIDPVIYKTRFTDYYSAEQNAKNLIGDKIIQLAETGDENTQLAANTYTDSEIKKADKEIRLAVNQYTDVVAKRVEEKVDGLEIGGRNYLLDSEKLVKITNYYKLYKLAVTAENFVEKTVTISFDAKKDASDSVNYNMYCYFRSKDAVINPQPSKQALSSSKWTRMSFTLTMDSAVKDAINVGVNMSAHSGTVEIKNVKLELGSTATDYQPAQEDLIDQAVVIAKKYTDTSISLIPGQITFGVNEAKEYADNAANGALAGSKTYTDNAITITKQDIELKADKDGIIGLINVSPESILIDSAKTHITGKTTIDEGVIDTAHIKNAAITSAKIKSITAGKIEAGTVKGLVLSSESATGKFSVEGQHAIFENTDTKDRLKLDSEGFVGYRPDGTKSIQFNEYMATTAKFGTSFTNAYITTGGTDGAEGEIKNGEARVVKYHSDMADSDTGGDPSNYIYSPIRAQGFTGGFLDLNTAIPGKENIYLRTDGGEVRVTKIGTTDDYQNIRAQYFYGNVLENNGLVGGDSIYLRPAAGSRVQVTAKGTTDNWQDLEAQDIYVRQIKQQGSDRDDMFIGLNGVLRITSRSTYDNPNGVYYRGVAASRFVTMSRGDKASTASMASLASTMKSASTMTNDEGGLDCIVKSADGETPESIQDPESGGVDLQKMSDVAWNAIRELNKKVKDLRSENEILRKELQK